MSSSASRCRAVGDAFAKSVRWQPMIEAVARIAVSAIAAKPV
jgi:hypothetical protein